MRYKYDTCWPTYAGRFNPYVALWGKEAPSKIICVSLKFFGRSWAKPFYDFFSIQNRHKTQQSDCRSAHRKLLDRFYDIKHTWIILKLEKFHAHVRLIWLTLTRCEASITAILAVKNWPRKTKKVSPNKSDWQTTGNQYGHQNKTGNANSFGTTTYIWSKFQRQKYGFWPGELEKAVCRRLTPRSITEINQSINQLIFIVA